MENLGLSREFWRGRRVLITGHTGFKGGWLSLWLTHWGAQVTGFSLPSAVGPSFYEAAHVSFGMQSVLGDLREYAAIKACVNNAAPEIVFHLAAQSLVRQSYMDPVTTYATNVLGLVHLFEAVRDSPSVLALINVTSDKCYENHGNAREYLEEDPLGGFDPYSSSKACAELVTSAYRRSFLPKLASARAGNVIGGGDWAADRLIPDAIRAFSDRKPLIIRYPTAYRPWQHVLEPLSGYLTLAFHLMTQGSQFASAWNFGPSEENPWLVERVASHLVTLWGQGAGWIPSHANELHEASCLNLNCHKAMSQLGWKSYWGIEKTLEETIGWYKAHQAGQDMRTYSLRQISHYLEASDKRDGQN